MSDAEQPAVPRDPALEPGEDPLASHRLLKEEPAGGAQDAPAVRLRRRRRTFPKKPRSRVRTLALVIASALAVVIGFSFSDQIVRLLQPGPSTPAPERVAQPEGQPPYTSEADWGAPAAEPAATKPPAKSDGGPSPQARRLPDVDAARASVANIENNVTGTWTVTNRIETSTDPAARNHSAGYRLDLTQQGTRVLGTASRVAQDGRPASGNARSRERVEGTIDGNELMLTVGAGGQWVLFLGDDGSMRGRFDDPGNTAGGLSVARRERAARN